MLAPNVNQAAAIANTTGLVPAWMSDAVRLCVAVVQRTHATSVKVHRCLR
jgi:hypothetical protein